MLRALNVVLAFAIFLGIWTQAHAQQSPLEVLTIERPPFAFEDNGLPTGFSIDLMRLIANELGTDVEFTFASDFPVMLEGVEEGQVDGAIANISITSEREEILDFSQPIFESGLQIMISGGAVESSVWSVLLRWDLLVAVLIGFGALFVLGLLMWVFERGRQPFFDRKPGEAMFPAFWWALNLVVNGGFEERMPRSFVGRVLGVVMVVGSLFLVSIFVARITATLTVEAITGSIQSLEDLDGRRVGTTADSTSSAFLDDRDVSHRRFADLAALLQAFESGELEAVFFDGPILAFYVNTEAPEGARLIERVFRPEDYGIALPQGSDLREPINRALLRLTETGAYDSLVGEWFGIHN